ncbi:YceD family protein [Thermodesulfobacterium hydrogeniphilum]|uniref:YceD family protein n=1 Tax=Thermodesulfobacterium hydrogeniphilum TaxID=161156 RepID=UPI00056E9E8A|nr:DUF177 domain-containing protein [Thermodesulfobacterium hydrogeniphilum]
MEDLKNWGVFLDDIPPEGLKIEFKDISNLGDDLKVKKPFSGYLKLKKIGIEVKLEGSLNGVLSLECDRCLTNFDFPIQHEFKIDIKPLNSLNIEGEKELMEEEMEVSFYENSWISFYNILREEIFLSIPYKKLCKPDCKGLCPICGTNLNKKTCNCKIYKKESPFAILKTLLKDKNLEKGGQ